MKAKARAIAKAMGSASGKSEQPASDHRPRTLRDDHAAHGADGRAPSAMRTPISRVR